MERTQPELVGLDSERLERIGPVMERYVARGELAGMVTLVARKGRIVQYEAYGWRNLGTKTKMSLDTIVRLYSMTKPVTAVALLMLYEQARFKLDDSVSLYLPEFAGTPVFDGVASDGTVLLARQATPMTVRQLLTHTSGLSSGHSEIPALNRVMEGVNYRDRQQSLADAMAKLASVPLLYQPGTRWVYSRSIDVVGHLVERLADQPLDEYMRERIFAPLGMADTGFYVPESKRDRLAALYGPGASGIEDISDRSPGTPVKLFSGGGGLFSTTADYARFAQMLCNGGVLEGVRLLGRKTVETMGSNHLPLSMLPFVPESWPYRIGYGMGLGVRVLMEPAISDTPGSAGLFTWGGAASTDVWIDPKEEMIGLCMPQYRPAMSKVIQDFRILAYQALAD